MKTLSKLILVLFSIVLFACSKSDEDKMLDALNAFAAPEVVDSLKISDTISMEKVREVKLVVDSAIMKFDSMIAAVPGEIAKAEKRIEEAQAEIKNNPYSMLKPIWEQILQQDARTIERYKQHKLDLENELKHTRTKQKFTDKAIANGVGETAYYLVQGYVKGNARTYFISPEMVILNEPVKDLEDL